MLPSLLAYSGVIASIWILLSIALTGYFYPNFNHKTQFCSELGATGSPTQQLTQAYKNKTTLGLYQRLCYGVQLIWLSALSVSLG